MKVWCSICWELLSQGPAVMTRRGRVELRAAELVMIADTCEQFALSDLEFDWLMHGDTPPHAPERWPETDEEHAALLAYWIREHDGAS